VSQLNHPLIATVELPTNPMI